MLAADFRHNGVVILAAVDGSSLANPGPSGWAWYIDDAHWAAGGWPKGTNNMGELMAVLDLLRATAGLEEPLRILCDSQYAINCCTRWIPAWKKRGWRKADNKPVLNLDLLKDLDAELAGRRVSFQWVKGHAGHPLNEKADDLARAAATAYQQGTKVAAGPGFSRSAVRVVEDEQAGQAGQADVVQTEVPAPEADDALIPLPATNLPDTALRPLPPDPIPRAQPDLLSVAADNPRESDSAREEVRRPTPSQAALTVDLTEYTRELMADETQLDRERLDELMHPDFVIHMPGGLIRTKGSIMARPANLSGGIQLDVLGMDQLDQDLVLLRYKLKRNSQDYLCAILWQRTGHAWRARFQQFTPVV